MFGKAGYFYVFFTYGIHWLLNIVTGPEHHPAAILIRAGIYIDPQTKHETHIKGPARLTKFLDVDKSFNGVRAGRSPGLWFEDRGTRGSFKVHRAKRIGVDYAGPYWSRRKWNFTLKRPTDPHNS